MSTIHHITRETVDTRTGGEVMNFGTVLCSTKVTRDIWITPIKDYVREPEDYEYCKACAACITTLQYLSLVEL